MNPPENGSSTESSIHYYVFFLTYLLMRTGEMCKTSTSYVKCGFVKSILVERGADSVNALAEKFPTMMHDVMSPQGMMHAFPARMHESVPH